MYRWIAIISLLLGCLTLGLSNERLVRLLQMVALCGIAVTAWGIASPTVLSSPHRPHRVGAWVLRGFWGILIVSLPFTHTLWQGLRTGCLLFGLPMLLAFVGRLHRMHGQPKMANIADLTAVFGFCTLAAITWVRDVPQVPYVLALCGFTACWTLVFYTLPTSATQTSAEDHRT